ncbi:MAG: hypothetical protein ACLPTJ_05845, partial [Solirubrobacteraceae bacterium]
LRLFITSMQNRVRPTVSSREIGLAEALPIVPIVAVILVLAFYPQFGLKRSELSATGAVAPAAVAQRVAATDHVTIAAARP